MLPDGIGARINRNSYEVPPVFDLLQKTGNITDQMMYNTYNMGIGMVLCVDPADADKTMQALKAAGEKAYLIGETVAGEKEAVIC
jgi:phosphoribosylformylglycinamidine cyclo-ligase